PDKPSLPLDPYSEKASFPVYSSISAPNRRALQPKSLKPSGKDDDLCRSQPLAPPARGRPSLLILRVKPPARRKPAKNFAGSKPPSNIKRRRPKSKPPLHQ